MKKFFKNRAVLMALMLLLILCAAGLFFAIGSLVSPQAEKELSKLLATPKPSPTLRPGISFAGLFNRQLSPQTIETFVTDIDEPHGLGVFDNILYVSSWADQTIYKVDIATGQKRVLTDGVDAAHDMAMSPDGDLV